MKGYKSFINKKLIYLVIIYVIVFFGIILSFNLKHQLYHIQIPYIKLYNKNIVLVLNSHYEKNFKISDLNRPSIYFN